MIKIVSRLPRAGGVISSQLVALGCALAGMLAWEAAEALWPGTHGPALLLPAIALAGAVGGRPGGVGCVLFLSLLTLGEELALGHGTLSGGEALTLLAAGLLVALVAGELRHVTDEGNQLRQALHEMEALGQAGRWKWNAASQTISLCTSAWRVLGRPAGTGPVSLGQLHNHLHPDDLEAFRRAGRDLETAPVEVVFRLLPSATGETRALLLRGRPAGPGEAAGVLMDVTAQHRAEQDWARAVARHERLYRELTHRVKNNFQLVSSLLRLQARRTPPEVKAALEMAGERIQSMAALHEALHQAGDAGSVPLDRYLETFAHWIIRHWMARRPVVLHVETVPASLSRDRTLPLGMAVAEMVSNALRHAFPEGRHGNIHLRLEREEDMLVLSVEDDGAGMDALAAMRSAGFGMTLLQSCARQLDGDLLTEHRPRTRFSLRFPEATPD